MANSLFGRWCPSDCSPTKGLDKRSAQAVKGKVESLLASKLANLPIPQDVATWLAGLSDDLYQRLARVGLVPPRRTVTLGDFLAKWLDERSNNKPSSLAVYRQVIANLLECFTPEVMLPSLTTEHGRQFVSFLQTKGLRPTTVAKRLSCAKTILNRAVELELLTKNPFSGVKAPPANPAERRQYVTTELIDQAIEAMPSVWWKLLLALARYQGLRTPSESLSLRWEHVLWAENRLVVISPKTEHNPGGESRVMPLFPQSRVFLEQAYEISPEGSEYIFPEAWRKRAWGKAGWKNANFRTVLEKTLLRCGIKPWSRLFHSLRASCETDLAANYPLPVVCAWIGNSLAIASKHYVSVLDKHFQDAVSNPPWGEHANTEKSGSKSGSLVAQNAAQQVSAKTCQE